MFIEGRNVSVTIDGGDSLSLGLNRSIPETVGDEVEVGALSLLGQAILNITIGLEGGLVITSPMDIYNLLARKSVLKRTWHENVSVIEEKYSGVERGSWGSC